MPPPLPGVQHQPSGLAAALAGAKLRKVNRVSAPGFSKPQFETSLSVGGVTDLKKLRGLSVTRRTRAVHPGPVAKVTPTGPAAGVAAAERDSCRR